MFIYWVGLALTALKIALYYQFERHTQVYVVLESVQRYKNMNIKALNYELRIGSPLSSVHSLHLKP